MPLFRAEEESARVRVASEVEATQEGEVATTVIVGGVASTLGATSNGVAISPSVTGREGDPTIFASKSTMEMGALGAWTGATSGA